MTAGTVFSSQKRHHFGTAPVYLAAISTILGAILFLRFGYAVGNLGLGGAILLVFIGHLITIPTGLAVAEIATNLRVRGGGEYFIISRSFGRSVGGAIGISLYLSQAISVAFYLIAFAEAFRPIFPWLEAQFHFQPDARMISLPAGIILVAMISLRGANIGVNVLWIVAGTLSVSLGMFFLGQGPGPAADQIGWFSQVAGPDNFFKVFAIVFPAFTGMTAGVGLSGDLKDPRRSIPLGTLAATLTGLVVYLLVVVKLAFNASPEELASDQFIMSRIAVWGPIIPIGLAAATLSSALGSILVAPRTLQALAKDGMLRRKEVNRFLAHGRGQTNDPTNATLVSALIILAFISLGNVDFVAVIISMFFLITYGALCSISFLEHFAGNPSYRPTFRTKWYFSLLGAAACFVMMFQMEPLYATLAVVLMALTYVILRRSQKGGGDLANMVRGALFQMTRRLRILIQKQTAATEMTGWRPSFIALSSNSRQRLAPFDLLRWISHYYGFASYFHFIKGPLDRSNNRAAKKILNQLIQQTQASRAGIYVDTIISPTFKTAVAQIVQVPGIAGMDNNSILFEFDPGDEQAIEEIIDGCFFAAVAGFNICILRSGERHFGYKQSIHIWLTPGDYRNANLMILLAYIILGHSDWKKGEIKLFDVYQKGEGEHGIDNIEHMILDGRLPISLANVQRVELKQGARMDELVEKESNSADLIILGLSLKKMKKDGGKYLKEFKGPQDVLFVRAGQDILIVEGEEEEEEEDFEKTAPEKEKPPPEKNSSS